MMGYVCALLVGLAAAARDMLDEKGPTIATRSTTTIWYTLGLIGGQNVAIECLITGRVSNNSAVAIAIQMRATSKTVRFGLIVSIGADVRSANVDIRLGGVSVSRLHRTFGGWWCSTDAGKMTPRRLERTESLNYPSQGPTICVAGLMDSLAGLVICGTISNAHSGRGTRRIERLV